MATKLTWQWTFPTGEVVLATLDLPSRVETVFFAARLVSSSQPGGSREGHAILLNGVPARLDFNADARQCILTQNGAPIPATRFTAGGGNNVGLMIAVILGAVLVFVGLFAALAIQGVRKYIANAKAAGSAELPLTASYRSPNGLLVAHYPADFAASVEGESVVQLIRGGAHDDAIVLVSVETPISNDPAELGRVVNKPILDAFASKGGTYTERTHGPGECIGHPGYTTSGGAILSDETVSIWSCAFVSEGHGYIVFATFNASYPSDDALLHKIVDATEIVATDSGAAPPSSVPTPATSASAKRGHKSR